MPSSRATGGDEENRPRDQVRRIRHVKSGGRTARLGGQAGILDARGAPTEAHVAMAMAARTIVSMNKKELTLSDMKAAAGPFAHWLSAVRTSDLYGVTDGKKVGTYIEKLFKERLAKDFTFTLGNSARGIDLPSIDTDLKCTSIVQPQSSCPFRNAKQEIVGLGYNLMVFVYKKTDDEATGTARLDIRNAVFIDRRRTADHGLSKFIRDTALDATVPRDVRVEEIAARLADKNVPVDENMRWAWAEEFADNPPLVGAITISNALQWRLQYNRAIHIAGQGTMPGEVVDLA